jgi:hypothetical protein
MFMTQNHWFLLCMLCLMFCTVVGLEGHLSNIAFLLYVDIDDMVEFS